VQLVLSPSVISEIFHSTYTML